MTLDDEPVKIAMQIKDTLNLKSSLVIKQSDFAFFSEIIDNSDEVVSINPIELKDHRFLDEISEIPETVKTNYDYIVCDFRDIYQKSIWIKDNNKITTNKSLLQILEVAQKLSKDGYLLTVLESGLWFAEWRKFLKVLSQNHIFVTAVFGMPDLYTHIVARMKPVSILFTYKKPDALFIADLELGFETQDIVNNFVNHKSSDNVGSGILIEENSFRGFNQLYIHDQILKLQTRYKEYESYTLEEISHDIKMSKSGELFEEADNAIYIPNTFYSGHPRIVLSLEEIMLNHQNYFQVLLNKSIVINEYAVQFYRSDIGWFIIDTLVRESRIPNITKSTLLQDIITKDTLNQMNIAVPSIEEQKNIIDAQTKLDSLEQSVEGLKKELSLNPKSAETVRQKIDDMLYELNMLSEYDQLVSLIRKGESKTLEFKETFVLNIRTKSRDEEIVKSSLKTIVAFLNTNGGTLLVGVHDNGTITGLNHEIDKFHKSSNDKFLLFFKEKIKTKIGEDFYPFIDYKLVHCEGKSVLKVIVEESIDPCYFNGEEFFVRTNPATDQLKGPKLVEYISRHFKRR